MVGGSTDSTREGRTTTGNQVRIPLESRDFCFGPVEVAMEVDSDLQDFFLSRARCVRACVRVCVH